MFIILLVSSIILLVIGYLKRENLKNFILKIYKKSNLEKIIIFSVIYLIGIVLVRYQMPANTPAAATVKEEFFLNLSAIVSLVIYPIIIPLLLTMPVFIKKWGWIVLVAGVVFMRLAIVGTFAYSLLLVALPYLILGILLTVLTFKTILDYDKNYRTRELE